MKIKAIILAVMLSFCAVACDSGENPGEEYIPAALENGFIRQGGGGGEPSNPYFVAYRGDKTEFPVDEVTLTFYFGMIDAHLGYGNGDEAEVYIKVFFLTGDRNSWRYTYIKELEDFYREEYTCYMNRINKDTLQIIYNHFEDITVPKELFIYETGRLEFGIVEYIVWVDGVIEPQYETLQAVAIYYKVTGQTVRLSSAEITD
jgi:hypothetical protein